MQLFYNEIFNYCCTLARGDRARSTQLCLLRKLQMKTSNEPPILAYYHMYSLLGSTFSITIIADLSIIRRSREKLIYPNSGSATKVCPESPDASPPPPHLMRSFSPPPHLMRSFSPSPTLNEKLLPLPHT